MIAPPPTPPAAKISKCSGIEMLTAIHAAQINKCISIQLPDFTRQFYRPSLPFCTLPQFAAIKILPMHITRVDYIHQPIAYCHTTILLPLSPPLCPLLQFAATKILPMRITRIDYIHQPIAYCHTTILLPLSPPLHRPPICRN